MPNLTPAAIRFHIGTVGMRVAKAFAETVDESGGDAYKLAQVFAAKMYASSASQEAFEQSVHTHSQATEGQ